jgi:hypothetical protein
MGTLRPEYDHIAHSRDFDAVERLWNLLVRASLVRKEREEFARIRAFVAALPTDFLTAWTSQKEADELLTMIPPLESLLSSPHERPEREDAKQELESLRRFRAVDSRLASVALLRILKRIRNKRVHGFKDPESPRDFLVLRAARGLLESLCAESIPSK